MYCQTFFFKSSLNNELEKLLCAKIYLLAVLPFLALFINHHLSTLLHHLEVAKTEYIIVRLQNDMWTIFEFVGVKGFSFVFLLKPNHLQHWLCANIHFSCYRYLYLFVILNVKCSWKLTIQFGCGGMEVVSAGQPCRSKKNFVKLSRQTSFIFCVRVKLHLVCTQMRIKSVITICIMLGV